LQGLSSGIILQVYFLSSFTDPAQHENVTTDLEQLFLCGPFGYQYFFPFLNYKTRIGCKNYDPGMALTHFNLVFG